MRELRCSKCNCKLAELDIRVGIVVIKCNKNFGKGKGACNTLNSFVGIDTNKDFPQIEINVI